MQHTLDGTVYALPFDIHASLWHMNLDIYEEAGLTDADPVSRSCRLRPTS
jgi:ABC-type glycerol-3-phosphate transport system substrate-binding protein